MVNGSDILNDLHARGLVQDTTDEAALRLRLDEGPITVYCGFDPTANSLHIGNLVPLLLLRRFQQFGHIPIALAGGATGMVGDPSGRSDERNLLDNDTLSANLAAIRSQLAAIVDMDAGAVLADNREWTVEMSALEFLRDVGKHVTVNTMLAKESIKSRLEGEQGISFTEFSYMLLQANDFVELNSRHGCELQVGGSDQWGNITAGIDMIRRRNQRAVHGLTVPLVTRSDGAKFGKTADGAVWLSAERTLPYEFHQYFMRTDDRDVERFLLQLTMLPVDDVALVMAEHEKAPEARHAQGVLADAVTALIHGDAAVRRARLAAGALFGGGVLDSEALEALRGVVAETALDTDAVGTDEPAIDLLVATGVCSSRSDARRTIEQGGIRVNGEKVTSASQAVVFVDGQFALVQRGKKQRHLAVKST
ncbi:MAG: tyrosyl-tRNA synthetase [Candidatus Aldehydirespiratoraceae bacterium]